MRKFKLKGALKDLQTGKTSNVKEIIIEGNCGNDAVCAFRQKLKEEGLYELDEDYSYMEII